MNIHGNLPFYSSGEFKSTIKQILLKFQSTYNSQFLMYKT